MTPENAEILHKINAYAEKTLADIDPQKTPVSFQLEPLNPVMEKKKECPSKTFSFFIWTLQAKWQSKPKRNSSRN